MHEQFHYTAASGAEITTPRMDAVKGKLLRETRKLQAEDRGWTLLESVASPEAMAQVDDLDASEVSDFFEKWSDTLGK